MPRIAVENVNHPGAVRQVDPDKYAAMRKAYLAVLPDAAPGLTLAEIQARLVPLLPDDQFPAGAKAGWWAKCVQLDLEAKGLVARASGSPIRLHRN